jgi:membrane-bound metal-dependent hydrolase YbcI (DUF457 family)
MFAVGHIALGYLSGKAASKLLDARINVQLLFFASIVPDVDFLLGLEHRGPTHSLILQTAVFIPIFLAYKKRSHARFFLVDPTFAIGRLVNRLRRSPAVLACSFTMVWLADSRAQHPKYRT